MRKLFTPKQTEFLKKNVPGRLFPDLTTIFNRRYKTNFAVSQIKSFCIKNGMKNGMSHRWGTGVPKKRNGKYIQIGDERIIGSKNLYVKISDKGRTRNRLGTWILKRTYIWEQAHGKVPKGYTVIHLNSDKSDFSLKNLVIATPAEILNMNRIGVRFKDTQSAKAGLLMVRLSMAIRNAAKKSRKYRGKRLDKLIKKQAKEKRA